MEEVYKKDFHEPDNHDGVVSHPEPDILEWQVKWALGSTDNLIKLVDVMDSSRAIQNPKGWSYQVAFSKSGRPSSGHMVGKGQSSSQFPRRVVLKNVQTIRQLHSSPMLVRSCLKSRMLGFSIMWTKNFQMFKIGLEKVEEPEIKLWTSDGS